MQAQGEVYLRAPHLPTVCGWNGCGGNSFHYRFHPISIHPFLQGFHLGAAVLRGKYNLGDKIQIRKSPKSTRCFHIQIHPAWAVPYRWVSSGAVMGLFFFPLMGNAGVEGALGMHQVWRTAFQQHHFLYLQHWTVPRLLLPRLGSKMLIWFSGQD